MDFVKEVLEIPRIDGMPDTRDLLEEYLIPGDPVIITGALHGTQLAEWSPGYLKKRFGEARVSVCYSESGRLESESGIVRREEMTMAQYIDAFVMNEERGPGLAYAAQQLIPSLFPEMLPELPIANFVDPPLVDTLNLWVGPPRTNTRLHYDLLNNFLIQVHGKKRLVLFHYDQTPFLYAREIPPRNRHLSMVDLDDPDFESHPLLKEAAAYDVVLEAGEVLVLPPGCWHQVYSLTATISINVWWKLVDAQMLSPMFRRAMHRRYRRHPHFFDRAVRYRFDSFRDYARALMNIGDIESGYFCHLMLLEECLVSLGLRYCLRPDRSLKGVEAPLAMLERLEKAAALPPHQSEQLRTCFELGARVISSAQTDAAELEEALEAVDWVLDVFPSTRLDGRAVFPARSVRAQMGR